MPVRATFNASGIKARQRDAAKRGVKLAAEHLLQASRALVPHEEGTLERSGTVTVDDGGLRAAVSYDTPYAVRQHEELTWKHDEGRQAKYLEAPLISEEETMRELIAAQVRRSLR